MEANIEDELDRKASKTKTVVFLVILGAVLLIGLVAVQAISSSGTDDMMNNGVMPPPSQEQSAGPVKGSTGPNSDTMPSPTGTGPGSDNSLSGQ